VAVGPGGRPLDFAMNDKCAAGTGRFLEVMARALQLELVDLGPCALRARRAAEISSTCTVFAESEVITLVAEGADREEIVAGICHSIARRVGAMARRVGVEAPVAFAGGVAKNIGVVRAGRDPGRRIDCARGATDRGRSWRGPRGPGWEGIAPARSGASVRHLRREERLLCQ
jgi:predicted CoA-substrate-specific enzyme activase